MTIGWPALSDSKADAAEDEAEPFDAQLPELAATLDELL